MIGLTLHSNYYNYKAHAEIVSDGIEFLWRLHCYIDSINAVNEPKNVKVGPRPRVPLHLGNIHINQTDDIPFPDADLEFSTDVSPGIMYDILENQMKDAHVIFESLNLAETYTGERKNNGWLK